MRSASDPALLAAFREAVRAKIAADLDRERVEAEARRVHVLAALQRAIAEARARGLCRDAWLFGSYAWGAPTERSDVDVLLSACRAPDAVAAVIGRHTGTDVHAVDVDTAPEALRARAISDGIVL